MNKTKSTFEFLECSYSEETFSIDKPQRLNPKNGKPLLARYNLDKAIQTFNKDSLKQRRRDMWKFEELLPVFHYENIVSLGEGDTPLFNLRNLEKYIGINELFIKDESNNPTGSFKARGLSAAISKAKEYGIKGIVMLLEQCLLMQPKVIWKQRFLCQKMLL